MAQSSRWIVVGLVCAGLMRQVATQATTTANCSQNLWTFNERHQSPCLVAAALLQACAGAAFNVPPILPGNVYSGPVAGGSNPCICSSVSFSMFAGCQACQGGSNAEWDLWKVNCTSSDISLSEFPLTIPANVTVPTWAYLPITASGIWDLTAALDNEEAGAPDVSAGGPMPTIPLSSTLSSSSIFSTPVSSLGLPTPSPTPAADTARHSSAAVIAGGVVGGVVGILLLCVAGLAYYRWKKHAGMEAPSSVWKGEKIDFGGVTSPAPVPSLGYGIGVMEPPPKLYDPADPSTFPATPDFSLPGYHRTGTVPVSSVASDPFSPVSPTNTATSLQHGRNLSNGTTSSVTSLGAQRAGYYGNPEI
ncbi:hypothetical protein K439DRAFT_1632856 [Ramaria rubella]|nr:hypothetical protein K439DRAFT_1632856 [Ramaria rubella]